MAEVSDNDWKHGTSAQRLLRCMADCTDFECKKDYDMETLDGMIQHLYNEAHYNAGRYLSVVACQTFNMDQMPTNYTLEELKEALEKCFLGCDIWIGEVYTRDTFKSPAVLSSKFIRVGWSEYDYSVDSDEEEEEEEDEESYNKCEYLQECQEREDRQH